MSAPRSSVRVLKHMSAGNNHTQIRNLHMTGPATFSSLLTSERPAVNLPRDIAGLRAECQNRKLPTTGTKAELMDRLSAHELTNSRAFSTAIQDSKRPTTSTASVSKPIRHFNTSRALKAPKDSSTVDFAYFPDFDPDTRTTPVIRVPILPQTKISESRANYAVEEEVPVMRPQIMTASADGTHIHAPSAMSEVSDSNSVDFQGMAARIASKIAKPVEEQAGLAKALWNGLMDDVLGPKQAAPMKA